MLNQLMEAFKQSEKEFNELLEGTKSCIKGLMVTAKYLPPAKTVTLHYPDEHWVMYKDTRNWLRLTKNSETGEELCTACGSCVRACPCSCIRVVGKKAQHRKGLVPDLFELDFSLCSFCGQCVEVCPFDAIKFCSAYEFACYDRNELIWNKEQLLSINDEFRQTKPKRMVDKYIIP
jgi:formate hydrogenlyase subunit 6/NADH:ubiquinone oxidoreductase subunit I